MVLLAFRAQARRRRSTQSSMPIAEALAREAEFFSTARFSSVRSNVGALFVPAFPFSLTRWLSRHQAIGAALRLVAGVAHSRALARRAQAAAARRTRSTLDSGALRRRRAERLERQGRSRLVFDARAQRLREVCCWLLKKAIASAQQPRYSEFKLSIDGGGQNILADRAVGGARLRQVFHDRFTQDLEQSTRVFLD